MNERRRRFDSDLLLLLFIPACGVASLFVALVIAYSVPLIVLPAVAENVPTPTRTRTAVIPTNTPPPTLTPSLTPAPNTPSATPASPTATSTFTPTPTEIPLNGIQYIAIYSNTNNLWVTNTAGDSVAEVSFRDPNVILTVLRDIPDPGEIAIWQSKGLAYVTNPTRDTVTEINLESRRVSQVFNVGGSPLGIAVDETSGDVYVTKAKANSIAIISNKTRAVTQLPWKYTANRIAWARQSGTFLVDNFEGTVQLIAQGSAAGDPFKVDTGLEAIALHSFFIPATVERFSPVGFYLTSPVNRRVYLLYSGQQRNILLRSGARAIADFDKCIGVVAPQENALFTLDYSLTLVTSERRVGAQGLDGGYGLAYNSRLDVAYVANHAANSITTIARPCPLVTPTPTPRIIPIVPFPIFGEFSTVTPTPIP